MKADITPRRPILRYHGGKWRLAPWIISHFPPHRVYVEPFGGAASVLLRKERSYAEVYNDLDDEIVNLFQIVRDQGPALVEAVCLTPFARAESEQSYQACENPLERARRTMARCGMGFGSSAFSRRHRTGFRGSATRSGTHPGTDWRNQPLNLPDVIERLRGVIIENRDAQKVMQYHDAPTTLHYVDPPYVHETRRWINAKDAYNHELTDDCHRKLALCLQNLTGMVVLSGYPCDLYDLDLYPAWHRVQRRNYADGARERTEVLWLNPATVSALQHNNKLQMEML